MSHIPYLLLEQLAILQVELEVETSEPLNHLLQLIKLFVERLVDDNIRAHKASFVRPSRMDSIRHSNIARAFLRTMGITMN
jgi:hypothetical protein